MSELMVVVRWYVAVQFCAVAALPLTLRFFHALPDRGYAFSKVMGPLLVGVVLWLGTSYGLLRNESGGAWFALVIVLSASLLAGGFGLFKSARTSWRRDTVIYVAVVEALFIAAFAVWAWVRAHDPAANHTEQPMDLMFMNSIWASSTYPPRDAWLAGFPISYYYLGYWLLTTLGHISAIPPVYAFNVGQASWFALLLTASFGLGHDLFVLAAHEPREEPAPKHAAAIPPRSGIFAGLLTAAFVGVIGNLQVVLEWAYAQGAKLGRLPEFLAVNGFPANAQSSGKWYIGTDWWWWRSSRVVADQDLLGNHVEVIDEFPMFSYILGDNHPHVLAMPVAIVVVAMALAVYLGATRSEGTVSPGNLLQRAWSLLRTAVPLGYAGLAVLVVTCGALLFLNTWDFPPYWLLLTGAVLVGLARTTGARSARQLGVAAAAATLFGASVALGSFLVYLPYFITAQSQAGGFLPNLLNPSRIQQVLLMFGIFVPSIIGLLIWYVRVARPRASNLLAVLAAVYGLPALFLVVSTTAALGTRRGQDLIGRVPLPEGATSHLPFIVDRWTSRPFTYLVFGLLLALCLTLVWQAMTGRSESLTDARVFTLLLTALGSFLVYAPEFIYLRDNFGTRMNTIFKFYYQAWMLLAVVAAFLVAMVLMSKGRRIPVLTSALAGLTVLGAVAGVLFPIAGTYSKTAGFSSDRPTLNASAYIDAGNPAEFAAAAWVLSETEPQDIVLEGKGASYRSEYNRISTLTGRGTLLGWDGHESQWRGASYAEMAGGRAEALERIYAKAGPNELSQLLDEWGIDFVYVGPTERLQYGITPRVEERLAEVMDVAYLDGDVTIYRRR